MQKGVLSPSLQKLAKNKKKEADKILSSGSELKDFVKATLDSNNKTGFESQFNLASKYYFEAAGKVINSHKSIGTLWDIT